MRKIYRSILFLCVTLTQWSAVCADEKDEYEILLEVSNVDFVLQSVEQQLRIEIATERIAMPDTALNQNEEAAYFQRLHAASLRENLLTSLRKQVTPDDVKALIPHYRNSLIKRYLAADRERETADGVKKEFQNVRNLLTAMPDADRIKLITEMESAEYSTERQLYVITTVMRERTKARLEYLKQYTPEEAQKLEYQLIQYKTNMEKSMRGQRRMGYYHVLLNFQDKEIRELIDLVQQDQVRTFAFVFTDSLVRAVAEGINHGIKNVMALRDKTKV